MMLALLRERLSASFEWISSQVSARPKTALAVWLASLVLVAWMF